TSRRGAGSSAASAGSPSSGPSRRASAHGLTLGEIVVVHEVAVTLDVAALAADDEDHEVAVARVRELARRRRLDVGEPAGPEFAHLAVDLEARRAAVHEVQLVLR